MRGCPGRFYRSYHGDDERAVIAELLELVDEIIKVYEEEGRPWPAPRAGRDFVNKMLAVAQ